MGAACRSIFTEAECGGDVYSRRMTVVQALLEARANPNATDVSDRTPLDFAISEDGNSAAGQAARHAMLELKKLGMMTRAEAVAEARVGSSSSQSTVASL